MKAYFISDVHLKNEEDPKTGILLRFLGRLHHEAQSGEEVRLFLLGDIFDLWVGPSEVFKRRYGSVVDSLEVCARASVRIDYFEGNHDLHLADFFQRLPLCRVHNDRASFQVGNLKIRLEHGDLMNPGDYGYKTLRWLLRTSPLEFAAKNLAGEWIDRLGNAMSHTSSQVNRIRSDEEKTRIQGFMRAYVESEAKTDAFDLMITGHTHVADDWDFEFDNRKIRFINLGCWDERPRALWVKSEATQLEQIEFLDLG